MSERLWSAGMAAPAASRHTEDAFHALRGQGVKDCGKLETRYLNLTRDLGKSREERPDVVSRVIH